MDRSSLTFPAEGDRHLDWNGRSLVYPEQMTACFVPVLNGEYVAPVLPDEPAVHNVLDIGAACGGFALWALKRWPGCKVTCVEPDEDLRWYLNRNVPEAEVIPAAIARESRVTLYLGPEGHRGFNSTYPIGVKYPWHDRSIVVPGVHPMHLPDADVLKIDAEGVEQMVLCNWPYLVSATWVIFEWHDEHLRRPCEEILELAGFHCVSARTQDVDMGEQTWCRTRARMCRRGDWRWMLPEEMPK